MGIGASALSKEPNPFTKQIAELLNLHYVEYSAEGCSNEHIFRYISYANTQYTNAIIIPVFTYLTRIELIDKEIGYVPQLNSGMLKNFKFKERRKQTEMYFGYIFNEQHEVLRFWNRLYDSQLATTAKGNTLIGIWDITHDYDQITSIHSNKSGMNDIINFKEYCFTNDNLLFDYPLEKMRNNELYMSSQSHTQYAQLLTNGKPQ